MENVRVISETFKQEWLDEILLQSKPYTDSGHWLYPSDENGSHLKGLFTIEPIVVNERFVQFIGDDMVKWAQTNNIDFDVIFAPAQPAVKVLANYVAEALGKRVVFWEYIPTGRFGDKVVEGEIKKGEKVIVFNGVSQQGRCVGSRLPGFVEALGGIVVAAAVFAKGNTGLVEEVENKYGPLFYSSIQVNVQVYKKQDCPMCQESKELKPWQDFLKETMMSS